TSNGQARCEDRLAGVPIERRQVLANRFDLLRWHVDVHRHVDGVDHPPLLTVDHLHVLVEGSPRGTLGGAPVSCVGGPAQSEIGPARGLTRGCAGNRLVDRSDRPIRASWRCFVKRRKTGFTSRCSRRRGSRCLLPATAASSPWSHCSPTPWSPAATR